MKLNTFLFLFLSILSFSVIARNVKKSGDVVVLNVNLVTKGTEMAFDQTALEVPLGKKIQLTYSNQSEASSEITHNVAIVKIGFEEKLIESLKKNDYDLEKIDPNFLVAKTKVLEPGEKDTITFKPDKAGKYTYICLMPGHGTMLGMKGILNVK